MIAIASKRSKRENILKKYPDAIIADVTSQAKDGLVRLSPDDVKAPLMRGLAFSLTSRLLPFYRLQALALEPCVTL